MPDAHEVGSELAFLAAAQMELHRIWVQLQRLYDRLSAWQCAA